VGQAVEGEPKLLVAAILVLRERVQVLAHKGRDRCPQEGLQPVVRLDDVGCQRLR
jgi:hypothetical protein